MATFSLTVNGIERAVSIMANTLDIFQTLDGPGSMEGDFLSEDGSLEVENDQSVVLSLDSTVLFSGYVMSWRLRGADGPAVTATITRIVALDNRGFLKRRVITETIPSGSTLKQALEQLIPYAPELTLESGQATGPTSTEDIVFTTTRLNEAISRVVTEIGAGDFTWRVNTDSELRAFEMGEIAAPFDFVEGDATECGDLEVEDSRDDNYANRVFVDGGIVTEYLRTESFTADGVQDEFPLLYRPFSTVGYVVNDGIFETLGTSPAEWEIDSETNVLRKVSLPVPTNGAIVSVTFDGTLHILGEADGRGSPPATEWAVYETVAGLSTIAQANEIAASILAEKMASAKIARYPTRILGLQVGQTQSLTSVKRHIATSDWLVRQIRTIYDGGSEGNGLLHTPEFSASGVVKGTFQQTYREWSEFGGGRSAAPPPDVIVTSSGGGGSASSSGSLIAIRRITATGAFTYTPSPGTTRIVLELIGAGGGGAGVASAGVNQVNLGGGAGAGAWLQVVVTSGFNGATGSVGAKGTGGSAGNNDGNNGGDTTFVTTTSVTYTAAGGVGGVCRTSFTPPITVGGSVGGAATNGDLNIRGNAGQFGVAPNQFVGFGGGGAGTRYGPYADGAPVIDANSVVGPAALGYGSGGSGATSSNAGGAKAGGNGADGLVIIYEYR